MKDINKTLKDIEQLKNKYISDVSRERKKKENCGQAIFEISQLEGFKH